MTTTSNSPTACTGTPRFVFSAYWHRWSVLLTDRCNASPGYGPTVEVDLEPHNGWHRATPDDCRRIRALNVRRHCTNRANSDRVTDALPPDREAEIRSCLGSPVFDFLTAPDAEILGIIDWERLHATSDGGSALRACVKPRFAHRLPAALIAGS